MSFGDGREVGRTHLRTGDQFELELNCAGQAWLEPWEGRSPRLLTECSKLFIHTELPAGGPIGNELFGRQEEGAPAVQLELPLVYAF